jgi:hypothetical protein
MLPVDSLILIQELIKKDHQNTCQFIMTNYKTHLMKYISRHKAKVLMIMFYSTGILGMIMGLKVAPPSSTVMLTFLGVINFGLGAFFTYLFLTQKPDSVDKRKKKRKDN